ncbi:MAG: radical SAM protein [bacterium]|nr:radical SAM protein [bacterium]
MRTTPRRMREAPALDATRRPGPPIRRHALLINPFYPKDPHNSFGKHVLTPTLALTTVAAGTPAEWSVDYWDENLLQGHPPDDPFPEVVGITVHLTFAARAYELARWYRERGARIVLGGLHVISCPAEVRPHADALAFGEGAAIWNRVLRDFDAGRIEPEYHADLRRPYREDPTPRRDLLRSDSYLTTTSLIATRGCHNRCSFCYLSTGGLFMPYQVRDVEQVVAEFLADEQPYGVFIDNNLGSRPAYLRQLCRALRPLEKIWSAAVSIDVADDPALVREMALAGCTGVFVGFESLDDRNVQGNRKKSPPSGDYARRVRLFHDHGIQVNGSFVLGFDHDDAGVFERTASWVEEQRLECATFHILTPYPGTPTFARMKAEGRLLHEDWSRYDTAHCVFRPRNMSPAELEAGYAWIYERLFSVRNIWKRRPLDWRAVLPYVAMSALYKRSNPLWQLLIARRWTAAAWRPLIELSRRRHVQFRARLAATELDGTERRANGTERGVSATSG